MVDYSVSLTHMSFSAALPKRLWILIVPYEVLCNTDLNSTAWYAPLWHCMEPTDDPWRSCPCQSQTSSMLFINLDVKLKVCFEHNLEMRHDLITK
jgi:hypothetical protein